MLAVMPDLDALVVAVGGGGLISGMATVAEAQNRTIEVIGVQIDHFPSMAAHLGKWAGSVTGGPLIAEGIAVPVPGVRSAAHAAALVDDMIVIDEGRIKAAIALLLQIEKNLCEGAGAAGLAAVLAHPQRFAGRRVGLVLCGGNIDNRLLTAVLQRQIVRDEKLFRLRNQLPDLAGMLEQLCTEIGQGGGNVNIVVHDRTFLAHDAKSAGVEVGIEVAKPEARLRIGEQLAAAGFLVEPR